VFGRAAIGLVYTGDMKESFEKPAPMLNEWDEEILREGIPNVVWRMYEDFGNAFPDAIVLIDTAARPLMYAIEPSIRRFAQSRGLTTPKYYFMTAEETPSALHRLQEPGKEFDRSAPDNWRVTPSRAEEVLGKKLIETQEEYEKVEGPEDDRYFDLKDIDFEKLNADRAIMKARATEILNDIEKIRDNPRIAIIDDMVATWATFDAVSKAFASVHVKQYPIVSLNSVDHDHVNSATNRIAFSWTKTTAIGVTSKDERGVYKHARVIRQDSAGALEREKTQLRRELSKIGEDIADTIEAVVQKKILELRGDVS
jgi:hypothetical protein